jgi:hypothetical protein
MVMVILIKQIMTAWSNQAFTQIFYFRESKYFFSNRLVFYLFWHSFVHIDEVLNANLSVELLHLTEKSSNAVNIGRVIRVLVLESKIETKTVYLESLLFYGR